MEGWQAAEIQLMEGWQAADLSSSRKRPSIAAASVAQVHRATLSAAALSAGGAGGAGEVAVKVQREGVGRELRADVHNLGVVMRAVRALDARFDFRPVLEEWSREALNELDFECEAQMQEEVGANLKRGGPVDLHAFQRAN